MEMTPLESSHIESIGYHMPTQVMTVKFRDGSTYEYDNVPESVHMELLEAESHGQHFNAIFKKGAYPSRRVF